MIDTFQALAVTVLAILPGALYTFSYERLVGSFGVALADRVIRFVSASALLHALLSGLTYWLYRELIITDRLARGEVGAVWIELAALIYVLLPIAAGLLMGHGRNRDWLLVRVLLGVGPEPRAWDYLWRRGEAAIVRLRLKSGMWLGGTYAEFGDLRSYASGYPEPGDLFLARQLVVDVDDGSFVLDLNGAYQFVEGDSGLLVHSSEIEYIDYKEWK